MTCKHQGTVCGECGKWIGGLVMAPEDLEDVPLSKAATESILAELATRELKSNQLTLARIGGLHLITPAEKDILDAAKGLDCKPARAILDDREDSEDRGASVPAPTGMMILGGRGAIRKVCEAVIRWRAAVEAQQDSGPGADRHEAAPPLGAGPGLPEGKP